MTAQEQERGRQVRRTLIRQAARTLEGRGVVWAPWARDRGFDPRHVAGIVRGERPCERGESRRAADMILREAQDGESLAEASARLAAGIRAFVSELERWVRAGERSGRTHRELAAAIDVVEALHGMARILAPPDLGGADA